VAAANLTASKYFSTGGDELNVACYEQDEPTMALLNSTGQTLYGALSDFTATTHGALEAAGKTPVVWEGAFSQRSVCARRWRVAEMVLVYNVTTLSNETLVMVWISSDNVAAVAQQGYKIIHAASDYFYLVRCHRVQRESSSHPFDARTAVQEAGWARTPLAIPGGAFLSPHDHTAINVVLLCNQVSRTKHGNSCVYSFSSCRRSCARYPGILLQSNE
jgi:N-acetyl-beta-hexosaminidase